MILGNDDTSEMMVSKQKASTEEIYFPWKEKRVGQRWRARSWGPNSNILLVDTRAGQCGNWRPVAFKLYDVYAEPCALGKLMYAPGASERKSIKYSPCIRIRKNK